MATLPANKMAEVRFETGIPADQVRKVRVSQRSVAGGERAA
jgi:hypothetical protein